MPADEPDPPRKFYDFKPREFERVNPPAEVGPLQASPIKGSRPLPTDRPIDVQDILREANAGKIKTGAPDKPLPKNDVHGHLKTNLDEANAAGLNELKPIEVRPSKRKHDYWLLMVVGNALFGVIVVAGHDNPMLLVCGVGGSVIFSVSLTWVMWFVMDKY